MDKYPKIETLYVRNAGDGYIASSDVPKGKVFAWHTRIRCPEFEAIRRWDISEKIDGMNIRIGLKPSTVLDIRGRSDEAQIPPALESWILENISVGRVCEVFNGALGSFTLYGEGYGGKIQKGGNYSPEERFILFDVKVGDWWLRTADVYDVAKRLGIDVVPRYSETFVTGFHPQDPADLVDLMPDDPLTERPEGIVARSVPQLFNRKGDRVMWKLKFRDF